MPNLQRQSSIAWLHAIEPEFSRRVGQPVRAIEDLAEVHPRLVDLGTSLDELTSAEPSEIETRLLADDTVRHLREVLAQLGPARLLRVLAWIETAPPRGEEILDALVQDDRTDAGHALRGILRELQRQALLARIFHPDRLALLQAVTTTQKGTT